ncbi:MAG: ribosome assembly cofactor RimP [Muribaculaceae bacterium]|nr:ribosome assembly cofactor RimP [Muribaculaceae bacterium]MBR1551830.1 ribosome assembly cofactor RimP [Muribaculaceae bacterium]
MIDKQELTGVIEAELAGSDLFVVQVTVSRDNIVEVLLDTMSEGVTIDDCVRVNNAVLAAFDRDVEDYELTVGSYGISSPLLLPRQYEKNLGGEVEVLTADGRKLKGVLSQAGEETFTVDVPTKVKVEGKKRPEIQALPVVLRYDEIKYTKNIIKV